MGRLSPRNSFYTSGCTKVPAVSWISCPWRPGRTFRDVSHLSVEFLDDERAAAETSRLTRYRDTHVLDVVDVSRASKGRTKGRLARPHRIGGLAVAWS